MARSYERINFALRPAKNVERKMLVTSFHRLSHIDDLANYRYIGFPSTFFSDFVLFHKALGINDMVGIEEQANDQDRFIFNCPYGCVNLVFGHSNDVLPELPLGEKKIIAWLDYDSYLSTYILADIDTLCGSIVPGSVFLVTVNAEPDALGKPPRPNRLSTLRDRVGSAKVPRDIREAQLAKWGTARVYRRIIQNQIEEVLSKRNGGVSPGEKIRYLQLFNFHYRDTTRMLSVGGIFYNEDLSDRIYRCEFSKLPFVRTGGDPYKLFVPNLTLREMRYVDKVLPTEDMSKLASTPISEKDFEYYSKIYRWFPAFTEAEL